VKPGFCEKIEVTRVPTGRPSRTTGWETLLYSLQMSHRSWSKSQVTSVKTAFNQSTTQNDMSGQKSATIRQKNSEKRRFQRLSHFFVQGKKSQHVRGSSEEKIRDSHINQFVMHPQKKTFLGCISHYGDGSLQPIEGMMLWPQYIDVAVSSNLCIRV